MNDAPTSSTGGDLPPISWGSAISDHDAGPGRAAIERRLGFPAAELEALVALPDDVDAMAEAVEADGSPFRGAFVPVVVHDLMAAERSYDAAEWAADLIRTAGGGLLVVAPYAEPEWDTAGMNARQWNHAAAMIERLDGVCQRFRLQIVVRETVGDAVMASDAAIDPDRPIRHILDTGRFIDDGLVPVELVCPERQAAEAGLVERFRGMLRDRT